MNRVHWAALLKPTLMCILLAGASAKDGRFALYSRKHVSDSVICHCFSSVRGVESSGLIGLAAKERR